MKEEFAFVKDVRGKGLMLGMELDRPVAPYIAKAQQMGLILINAGQYIIRMVPPLVISKQNVDDMIVILRECLKNVEHEKETAYGCGDYLYVSSLSLRRKRWEGRRRYA